METAAAPQSNWELDPALEGLEPKLAWEIFDRTRKCPVDGGNEEPFMQMLTELAEQNGCECKRDAYGNLCIHSKASPGCENIPPVAFQVHADGVLVKKGEEKPVFTKDTIQFKRKGTKLSAVDTSLLADNRLGMSIGLGIMFDSTAKKPRIQMIITKEEETSTAGASNMDPIALGLTSSVVVNLDNEKIDEICVTSAGINVMESTKPLSREAVEDLGEGAFIQIAISDMPGGHSGEDIQKWRGNANISIGELLLELPDSIKLVSVSGGVKFNVIPAEASAVVFVPKGVDIKGILDEYQGLLKQNWSSVKLEATLKTLEEVRVSAMTADTQKAVMDVFAKIPNGVHAMATEVKRDFPATSSNIGVVRTKDDAMELTVSVRSKAKTALDALSGQIIKFLGDHGFTTRIAHNVPCWDGDPESPVVQMLQKAYGEVTGGRKMKERATHGGLEGGIVVGKTEEALHKKVHAASTGPSIWDPHSDKECTDTDSVVVLDKELRRFLELFIENPIQDTPLAATSVDLAPREGVTDEDRPRLSPADRQAFLDIFDSDPTRFPTLTRWMLGELLDR